MKDAELVAMRPFIDSLSDNNCALFMWATMPRLDFAIRLMEAWGFRYVTTAFVWVKSNISGNGFIYGPGYYTASNTEIVLLGVRGACPPVEKMVPSIVYEGRGKHSEKPLEAHRRIERMYPEARKLELFARRPAEGWDVWGNQAGGESLEQ